MNVWESVKIAFQALRTNRMRTSLTMLGMIIGVGAVIAMVAIGQGAAAKIQQQFQSMGTNMLTVIPGNGRFRPGPPGASAPITSLVLGDAKAIEARCADSVSTVASVCRGTADVKKGNHATQGTQIVGVTPAYEVVAKLSAEEGRFLNDQDEEGRARVAVIGRSTLESLTGDRHASVVGDSIQINRVSFTVVGVLKEKGAAAFGMDQDDMIVIPCSTAMRRVFSRTYLSEIGVSARSESDVDFATEEIANILRDRHKIRPPFADNDDFNVRNQAQIMDVMAQSSGTMTSLLGGIALVSLVVGGIGIMNIMLVSVTERTREIGVRKAVGATSNNILSQFLIEAVVISTLGGAIGIAAGAGVSKLLASMLQWDVLIQPSAVIAAVAVSATVGIFFGIYPARAAARLHPIEALRYE